MRTWFLRLVGALVVLALGIVLGAGPLQKSNERRNEELTAQKRAVARKQQEIASLQASTSYSADYARSTAPALVRGALKGRSVTVLALPGADADTIKGIGDLISAAGGKVTASVGFEPVMGKASSRQLVEALTSQMATQSPDVQLTTDAGGYQRFGLLLARAVGLPASTGRHTAPYDDEAVGIVSGFKTAGLLGTADVSTRADLTVAVTGPGASDEAGASQNAVPVTVLSAYASRAPVVVAGPASSAGKRGILGALRGARAVPHLSTVDTTDAVSGQVATVLALAALAGGTTGSWGGSDAADGPVPALR